LLCAKDNITSRSAIHVAALCDNSTFIEAACSHGAPVDQVESAAVCGRCCLVRSCVAHCALSWTHGCGPRCTLQQPAAV
jgi:hypothetical protein